MNKVKIGIVCLSLLLCEVAIANPRIISIYPLDKTQFTQGGVIGISVVFSESVYGFTVEDIVTNGRILALEGGDAHYRVVISPNQWPIIMDILTDSVFNIRGEGNDPFSNPIIIYRSGQIAGIPGDFAVQGPDAQPALGQASAKKYSTPPFKPIEFVMNLGAYSEGAPFLNVNDQADGRSDETLELTLGFEILRHYEGLPSALGYQFMVGYQETSYSDESKYTAIPVLAGLNFYFNRRASLGIGLAMHFEGEYTHESDFRVFNEGTEEPVEDAEFNAPRTFSLGAVGNSFDAGLPGGYIDFTYTNRNVGFVLRYLNIPLAKFENPVSPDDFGALGEGDYSYINDRSIETFGIFIQFRG